MRNKKGLTLVELMVALLIFGVFMASLVQVLSLQNRKSVQVQTTSNLHMDAQVAFDILKNDIYHAGLGISVDRFPILSNDGGDNPDAITLFGVALGSEIPELRWNPVIEKSGNGVFVCLSWEDTTKNIQLNDNIVVLASDKTLIYDTLKVTQVRRDRDTLKITVNNNSASCLASSNLFVIIDRNIYLNGITYHIENIDGVPVLMRGNERFLENVEDIQFAYGLDINNDGEVEDNEFRDDLMDFEDEIDGFSSSTLYDRKFLVRLSMLVRTENRLQDVLYPENLRIENRTINFTPSERKYDRVLLTTTISPRNVKE